MSDPIIDYHIPLVIVVIGWPIVGIITYRVGVRSQTEAAKRESRISALSLIDSTIEDVSGATANGIDEIHRKAKPTIKDRTFDFSSRLKTRKRTSIESAWKDYSKIASYQLNPAEFLLFEDGKRGVDLKAMRQILLNPLSKLRKEIEDA